MTGIRPTPLGPPPQPGTDARIHYENTIGHIAARREQHNIRATTTMLGDKPRRAATRGTWQHLTAAADTLTAAAEQRARDAEHQRQLRAQATAAAAAARRAEQARTEQQRLHPPGPTTGPPGPRIGM